MPVQPEVLLNNSCKPQIQEPVSLYIHIPFCHTKCFYCDFNSYAGLLGWRSRYVQALVREIEEMGAKCKTEQRSLLVHTIFLGGGTPSLLLPEQMKVILNTCRKVFTVDEDAEITSEANPGTLTQEHVTAMRAAGINRLSMGAQSFDPVLLKTLGRIHGPEEIVQAYDVARRAGMQNINLDFMFALPGQTMEQWKNTLNRAIQLGTEHLSLYSLIIEENTSFYDWYYAGKIVVPDEDAAADMYEYAEGALAEAGYRQYEISNWAKPGFECRHNLTYWHNRPYLGFGAGAYSWFDRSRYSNIKPVQEYIQTVNSTGAAIVEAERISPEYEMAETAMLMLRLNSGIHLEEYEQRFNRDFSSIFGTRFKKVLKQGLLEEVDGYLRLTPKGRLLGNEVFECALP